MADSNKCKKGASDSKKRQYQGYRLAFRWLANQMNRIERHLKRYPNDETARDKYNALIIQRHRVVTTGRYDHLLPLPRGGRGRTS
jgi:ribosomal protein S15P/S13E